MDCEFCCNYLDPWETICLNCGTHVKSESELLEEETEAHKSEVREFG